MDIEYKENSTFTLKQLVELYENVGWISYSNKPSELKEAIKNSLFNICLLYTSDAADEVQLV